MVECIMHYCKGYVIILYVSSLILKGIIWYLKYLSEYDNVTCPTLHVMSMPLG